MRPELTSFPISLWATKDGETHALEDDIDGREAKDGEGEKPRIEEAVAKNLKLGIRQVSADRYFSTATKGHKITILKYYLECTKDGAKDIYTGGSRAVVSQSPSLERLKECDLQRLHIVDPIGEYDLHQLKACDDDKRISVAKHGVDRNLTELTDGEKTAEEKAACQELCKRTKEMKVENVVTSDRMADSPCLFVVDGFGRSARMEQEITTVHALWSPMFAFLTSKETIRINQKHAVTKEFTISEPLRMSPPCGRRLMRHANLQRIWVVKVGSVDFRLALIEFLVNLCLAMGMRSLVAP